MNLTLAYRGRSAIVSRPGGLAVALAPNLRRDRVAFDAAFLQPLRFREAIGALHDVVVSDHRYHAKDNSAYESHLADRNQREAELRRTTTSRSRTAILKESAGLDPADIAALETDYRRLRTQYWGARQNYSNYLTRHDPELWRLLVPCDPVVTVAPDCLFFECFSVDESSYGCLTVDRAAFSGERDVALGTTNVDYSWSLYEHFQTLRSYRETRFLVDPAGIEVQAGEEPSYREEKIDLPPSWLRGFMQIQAAMSLPMRRVSISREGLYSVLAFLKRHRASRSPRAVRFELIPGQPVAIILEPWERRIVLHSHPYDGPRSEVIRVWGRDRLRLLARLLPLMDEAEVYLLGTGLPSFWSVRMGEMRLLLGLSGWTANDWTGSGALDQLAPPAEPSDALLGDIAAAFEDSPAKTFDQIRQRTGAAPAYVTAGLNRLALMGQLIHDLHAGLYRWRQIMPVALALDAIGPENAETAAARELVAHGKVKITRDDRRDDGLRILEGEIPDRPVSLLLDADGRMLRGKCTCSHHFTGGLRRGPCRHLQALRDGTRPAQTSRSLDAWFASFGF
ncbi:hypothetical protein SAMN05444166_0184 [Singulisphaera sp. GP187]|uniref:hypothetical protein n=1 Tax=Singulisphaera sp. GP187 TaxID=1882752 RepID=UPI00092A2A6F|nr:hypothetical protein [Singulisphaera sp. GP187]SIN69531.1 hypothetical protein SAMN05444166_0184 [Singulisphaera sp. GP187]